MKDIHQKKLLVQSVVEGAAAAGMEEVIPPKIEKQFGRVTWKLISLADMIQDTPGFDIEIHPKFGTLMFLVGGFKHICGF